MKSTLDAANEKLEKMKSTGPANAAEKAKLATAEKLIGANVAKIRAAISGVAADAEVKASAAPRRRTVAPSRPPMPPPP
jgi:hypothetical protein